MSKDNPLYHPLRKEVTGGTGGTGGSKTGVFCSEHGFSEEFTCPKCREKTEQRQEKVNHPQHYGGDTTYETIKVLEAWGVLDFCIGNAIKYLSRVGKKPESPEIEDLKKALWYINRRIEQLEKRKP